MKNLIQLFTAFILLTILSCKSVEKLVEEGKYDQAIELAVKKLAGEKNKNTDHVKSLERSFRKANQRDLDQIDYLISKGNASSWDQVFDLGLNIEKRQEKISPLLPLISENGYEADFEFVDVSEIKLNSADQASLLHFERGCQLLNESRRKDDKFIAREAYTAFETVQRYNNSYPGLSSKLDSAIAIGMVHLLFSLDQSAKEWLPIELEDRLLSEIDLNDRFWTRYYLDFDTSVIFDYLVNFNIQEIVFSPEREQVRQYQESVQSTELEESASDSTSQQTYKTIQIFFEEVVREKNADLIGSAIMKDFETGNVLDRQDINVGNTFLDKSLSHNPDPRARQGIYKQGRLEYPAPFPTDILMIESMIPDISQRIERFISSKRL